MEQRDHEAAKIIHDKREAQQIRDEDELNAKIH